MTRRGLLTGLAAMLLAPPDLDIGRRFWSLGGPRGETWRALYDVSWEPGVLVLPARPTWFCGALPGGRQLAQWYNLMRDGDMATLLPGEYHIGPHSRVAFKSAPDYPGLIMTEIRADRDGQPGDLLAKVRDDGVVLVPHRR